MITSIYFETSVIGAYLDKGESFRRDLTIRWWEHELKNYRAYVSPLVARELERAREPYRRSYLQLISALPQLDITEEAAILADGTSGAAFSSGNIWATRCTSRSPRFTRSITW